MENIERYSVTKLSKEYMEFLQKFGCVEQNDKGHTFMWLPYIYKIVSSTDTGGAFVITKELLEDRWQAHKWNDLKDV